MLPGTPLYAVAAENSLSTTELYYRAIWGLLVVTGSILIIYGLVRKRFSILTTSGDKHIQITEIKPLMGKKALCLVEVKGQEFLIGLTGDSITHLATLNSDQNSFANTLKCTQKKVEGQ